MPAIVGGESEPSCEALRLSDNNVDNPFASNSPGDIVANSFVNNCTKREEFYR